MKEDIVDLGDVRVFAILDRHQSRIEALERYVAAHPEPATQTQAMPPNDFEEWWEDSGCGGPSTKAEARAAWVASAAAERERIARICDDDGNDLVARRI